MISNRTRAIAMVAALLLVTSVVVPALGAAADSSLTVDVEQQPDTGDTLVSVFHNGTAVDSGTLLVNASGNYSANESYTLSRNGTVTLPAPNETVDVELTAEYENTTVTETVTLVPLGDSLRLTAEQHEDGSASAVVTQYGDPVENATVTVAVEENESYDGAGEYLTTVNGTIELPAPDTSVTVSLSAEYANVSDTESLELSDTLLSVSVAQDAEGSVTISVLDAGEYVDGADVVVESENYTYTGTYTADNGTVSLPAPTQNVTVTIIATADNETATTTAELSAVTDENPNNDFASQLTQFIDFLKSNGVNGPLGQEISAFVHDHNPSSADDDRGPPAHSNGNAHSDTESQATGQSSVAADENDSAEDRHGPPENANANGHGADSENDTQAEDETEDSSPADPADKADEEADNGGSGQSDKDRRGPPEHANGR